MTVPALSVQERTLKTATTLELEARLDATESLRQTEAMVISLNNQVLRQWVTNRSMNPQFADGATFSLFNPESTRWAILSSPDFTAHNTASSGGNQITTNAGQAYRYVWNVAAQQGSVATMTLRVDNRTAGAQAAPLILRITQR